MENKIGLKKEILYQKIEEIKQLKENIKDEIKEYRMKKANNLLNKYRENMIGIIELYKKQEETYKKIHDENYHKHEGLCSICDELEWDDVYESLCPLAFICGYIEDGYGLLDIDKDKDENNVIELLKKKNFKKEDIVVLEEEV